LGCTVAGAVFAVGAEWLLLLLLLVVVVAAAAVVVVVAAAAADADADAAVAVAAAAVAAAAVVSAEQVVEMSDVSVYAAVAVVVTEVAVVAADDADVLAADKHTGSVGSCQFHCYPGSRPTENTSKKKTCIKQLISVINCYLSFLVCTYIPSVKC
jgi:cytochrome c biogenesis factor